MAQKNGQEKAQNFPLSLTSTGIINLGILALLIERKILDKGTFVFIDEPEAHLHPAWQVVMAESLLELAKDGAYVVIATHSIDILKWLEVHAKKNPEDKENLIELNQFSSHGVEGGSRDFDEKMARILQELTDPFAKNFIDGV
ncbi:MAG: ATP-binding protein [Alphaproteobacteria bacterium]|nr:ATP-binding protein [Alphaproteobacteria bacterium]